MKRNLILILLLVIYFGTSSYGWGRTILGKGADIGDTLIYPGKMAEGPDGNIYVADYKDFYIKVYSPDGTFLRKIGGRGEGPGQMKRMGSFGFSSDSKHLFFTEFFNGHSWITFTDLEGKYEKVFKLNIGGRYGISTAELLPDHRFILKISESSISGDGIQKKRDCFYYSYPNKIALLNTNGTIEKVIVHQKHFSSMSKISDGADITIPFQPEFFWAVLRNNQENKIIFSDGLSTKLKVYDLSGKQINEISTPIPEPEPVTSEDLEKWRKQMKELNEYKYNRGAFAISGKVIDQYRESVFKHKPNISALSITPQDKILLEGKWDSQKKSKIYWLLDNTGSLLCKVRLKVGNVKITRHFILFTALDEEEEKVVCVENRKKGECEDLKILTSE